MLVDRCFSPNSYDRTRGLRIMQKVLNEARFRTCTPGTWNFAFSGAKTGSFRSHCYCEAHGRSFRQARYAFGLAPLRARLEALQLDNPLQ